MRQFIKAGSAAFWGAVRDQESATADANKSVIDSRLRPTLDAMCVAAILGIEHSLPSIAEVARHEFIRLYERAQREQFGRAAKTELDAAWVWLEVMKRVYLVGATLMDHRQYEEARQLADYSVTFDEYWARFLWARHPGVYARASNRTKGRGLVSETLDEVGRESGYMDLFAGDQESAADALCRYDFLQCLWGVLRRPDDCNVYPNFAFYYRHRVEPFVRDLIADSKVRHAVAIDAGDHELAEAIDALDRLGGSEAVPSDNWSAAGWRNQVIVSFLNRNWQRPTASA